MIRLVKFAVKNPLKVLVSVFLLTALSSYILISRFAIETSPTKSFSRDLDVVRFYNTTGKKFDNRDYILIGIENSKDSVFSIKTLRYIESIVDRIGKIKVEKRHHDIIIGKDEVISVPSGIMADKIISLINVDDINVDKKTNTIVIGTLTDKAKKRAGLKDSLENGKKGLPESDEELTRLLPHLKQAISENKILSGTLISENEKACAVLVPIEKMSENKLKIVRHEIYSGISETGLQEKFSGNTAYFPHDIYNKSIGDVKVDDAYIAERAAKTRSLYKEFFVDLFAGLLPENDSFHRFLKDKPVDEKYLDMVFRKLESDAIYEDPSNSKTYDDIIDDVYAFTTGALDDFSKNNLESRIYNVANVYDTGLLYNLLVKITEKNTPEGIATYIAGRPVAEALIEKYVVNDMSVFMFFTSIVIILILYLGFRSKRGVLLPLSAVGITIIWVMALMLFYGLKITSGTITLPTILLAIGSAYVIHYLTRYYEEALKTKGQTREDVILNATGSIHVAINLTAITTIAAFLSVVSSAGVTDIKYLGILTSIGIAITILLTYTYIPAVLALIPLPLSSPLGGDDNFISKLVLKIGSFTYRKPKVVFLVTVMVSVVAFTGIFFLKTESSITYFFRDDNPIRVSSEFIDKNLTGTGEMNIVLKMRDRVNLSSKKAKLELSKRIDSYLASYRALVAKFPALKRAKVLNRYLTADMSDYKIDLPAHQGDIEKRTGILENILNENYEIEGSKKKEAVKKKTADAGGFDFASLADDSSLASDKGKSEFSDGIEKGIADILKLTGEIESVKDKKVSREFIIKLRSLKKHKAAAAFQRNFYQLADFFATDIKQPATLRKIDTLTSRLKDLKEPKALINGTEVNPVGKVLSITDTLKIIYKVFYHDGDERFNKIPDVSRDNIADKTLTDRGVIGVCINQFSASRPELFRSLSSTDGRLIQFMVYTRSDKADFLNKFSNIFYSESTKLFPHDDPYVEKVIISGLPAINMTMNRMLLAQQKQSILVTLVIVFLACVFIFSSFAGGFMSIIPITITLGINLGIMGWFDFPINYGTVIIASIAIGAGIDYTIHFLERFKNEHLVKKHDVTTAYFNTLRTIGKAIAINALSMAGGFAVLMLSTFKMLSVSGFMVALAMLVSSIASITILPAIIFSLKPGFLTESADKKSKVADSSRFA